MHLDDERTDTSRDCDKGDNINNNDDHNNIRRYRQDCLENGETGECFNQRSNVYVTKQGQSLNGRLSALELEAFKRKIGDESPRMIFGERKDVTMEAGTVELVLRQVKKK